MEVSKTCNRTNIVKLLRYAPFGLSQPYPPVVKVMRYLPNRSAAQSRLNESCVAWQQLTPTLPQLLIYLYIYLNA